MARRSIFDEIREALKRRIPGAPARKQAFQELARAPVVEKAKGFARGVQEQITKLRRPAPARITRAKPQALPWEVAQPQALLWVGQQFQKAPEFKIPEEKVIKPLRPLIKIAEFAPAMVGEQIRSWGRTIERVSTPKGRKELVSSAKRIVKDPFRLETFQEPAVEAFFDIPDFLPGGLLFSGVVEKLGREAAEKLAKEVAEKGLKEVGEKATREVSEKAVREITEEIAPLQKKLKVTAKIPTGKYAESINIERLKLSTEGEQVLRGTIDDIKPELQAVKGKTLTHNEVLKAAQESDILQQVSTREAQQTAEAALLRTRQSVTGISNKIGAGEMVSPREWQDYLDGIRVINSQATEKGRALEALKIEAEGKPLVETIMKQVLKNADDTDKVMEAAKKVDFSDAKQATKFYREFVKPTWTEIFDEYRYNNMLSNPRTHIRNAFSNLTQTFITRPATILFEKGPKEMAEYYGGALKGIPEGIDSFLKTMRGEAPILKPDLDRLPTRKLPEFMTIPTRAMEAGDKFFSPIIRQGELARGATAKQADEIAEYSLFRAGLSGEGQGPLLNAIDGLTEWLAQPPKPGARGIFARGRRLLMPFVRTPLNFAKQFIEYSPAGVLTIPGAANKKAQFAKATLGSIITLTGAQLAVDDRLTLSAPTSKAEKTAFYSAGKRPFSVRIGDNWVPMMYAGPFAFALVLPAIVNEYTRGEKADEEAEEKIRGIVGDTIQFVSNQTPLAGVNNFIRLLSGDLDRDMISNLIFTSRQMIPFDGLVRYISQALDPVYRKGASFKEKLMKDLPLLSKQVEPYLEVSGEPAKRDITAFITPYTIGKEKPELRGLVETYAETRKLRKEAKKRTEGEAAEAEKIWAEIREMPRGEQLEKLTEYRESGQMNQKTYNRVKALKKSERRGWTKAEESVYNLGPIEEAKYHWKKIKDWSREKQIEYLDGLKARGLLTKQTYEELRKLKGG